MAAAVKKGSLLNNQDDGTLLAASAFIVCRATVGSMVAQIESFTVKKRKMDALVPKNAKHTGKSGKLIRQQVGTKLQQLYADVMSEPIPDRFKELIDALETEQEREQSKTRHPKQDKRS